MKLTIKENGNVIKIFMDINVKKIRSQPHNLNISILIIKNLLKINLLVRAVCIMTVSNLMKEELSHY
jgi:hypothetical protein